MNALDPTVFGRLRLLWEWYQWGAFVAFVLALGAVFWVFYDSQRRGKESVLWKILAVVSLIVVIPSVLLRIDPSLALNIVDAVEPLAFLGIAGGVVALITLFAYSLGVGVSALRCPHCGQVQDPTWDRCPYCSAVVQPPPTPLAPVAPRPGEPYQPPPIRDTIEQGRAPYPFYPDPVAVAPPDNTVIIGLQAPTQFAWLVQLSGMRKGREWPLGNVTNIGRDARANDIVVDDSTVSRQHARVRLDQGVFVVFDLASANGTFVNGEQTQKQALSDGDRVTFGKAEFCFMEVKEARA